MGGIHVHWSLANICLEANEVSRVSSQTSNLAKDDSCTFSGHVDRVPRYLPFNTERSSEMSQMTCIN